MVVCDVILQLVIVGVVWEWVECLEPGAFRGCLIELTPGGRQFASCRIQKNHRNHHADSEGDQERTEQSILAKPIHWNFTGRRRVSWSSYGKAHSRSLGTARSEEHTSELQSHSDLVCR